MRLTPKAAHDGIVGWQADARGGDLLRVRVTAPPVDGKANAALERVVAKAVSVPKSAVRVVTGARGREKTVEIEGRSDYEVRKLLERAIT